MVEDSVYHNKAWPSRKESYPSPSSCNAALVLSKREKWSLEMTFEPVQGICHLLRFRVSLQREKAESDIFSRAHQCADHQSAAEMTARAAGWLNIAKLSVGLCS